MAKKMNPEKMRGEKAIFGGLLLFLIGLMLYAGFDWSLIIMIVGAIIFLKGLLLNFKK